MFRAGLDILLLQAQGRLAGGPLGRWMGKRLDTLPRYISFVLYALTWPFACLLIAMSMAGPGAAFDPRPQVYAAAMAILQAYFFGTRLVRAATRELRTSERGEEFRLAIPDHRTFLADILKSTSRAVTIWTVIVAVVFGGMMIRQYLRVRRYQFDLDLGTVVYATMTMIGTFGILHAVIRFGSVDAMARAASVHRLSAKRTVALFLLLAVNYLSLVGILGLGLWSEYQMASPYHRAGVIYVNQPKSFFDDAFSQLVEGVPFYVAMFCCWVHLVRLLGKRTATFSSYMDAGEL